MLKLIIRYIGDMLSVGVVISEEGYGHAARQIAITQNLLRNNSDIEVVFYCDNLAQFISDRIPENFREKIKFKYFSNNFRLFKNSWGCIDFEQSLNLLIEGVQSFEDQARCLVNECDNLDIIITDSVPFVSVTAESLGIPSISVNHFSWSWYIKKLMSLADCNISNVNEVIEKSISLYSRFDVQFILPLHFQDDPCISLPNAMHLDEFIISTDLTNDHVGLSRHNSILLMDNGTRSLRNVIEELAPTIIRSDLNFTIKICDLHADIQKLYLSSENVNCVFSAREMHHQIIYSEALIARGGFNTISESLFSKTPAAYIYETGNPEITANLEAIKKLNNSFVYTIPELLENLPLISNKLQSTEAKLQSLDLNSKFRFSAAQTIADKVVSLAK